MPSHWKKPFWKYWKKSRERSQGSKKDGSIEKDLKSHKNNKSLDMKNYYNEQSQSDLIFQIQRKTGVFPNGMIPMSIKQNKDIKSSQEIGLTSYRPPSSSRRKIDTQGSSRRSVRGKSQNFV